MKKTKLDKSNRVSHKPVADKTKIQPSVVPTASQIKLGLDLSLNTVVVVRQLDGQSPQPAQKFTTAKFLLWAKTQVETGAKVYSVYEAGPFGFGLHRDLSALGIVNYVVCPQNLDERGTGVKTDGIDAQALCLRLDRYVAGNTKAMAVVRIPTPEEEQLRSANRQRDQLVKARKQLEAQGKSLLLYHGLAVVSGWWRPQFWKNHHPQWPSWLVERLKGWQRVLESIEAEIACLTLALQQRAATPVPKGLGAMTVVSLQQEVGDWNRFNNRREVASFCGLCPRQYSSGAKVKLGTITKHGSPRMRYILVELAWRMFQFQPTYLRLVAWKEKMTKGPINKNKMIVALARQLAVDLWRLHTRRTTAEKLGLIFA